MNRRAFLLSLCATAGMMLTGCSEDDGGAKDLAQGGVITPSRIAYGPRSIWYRLGTNSDKNSGVDLFVFENGTLTRLNAIQSYSLSEIRGMSDEEVVAEMLESGLNGISGTVKSVHMSTDETGMQAISETITVEFDGSDEFDAYEEEYKFSGPTRYPELVVLEDTYAGYWGRGESYWALRNATDVTFELDDVGAEGVELDY